MQYYRRNYFRSRPRLPSQLESTTALLPGINLYCLVTDAHGRQWLAKVHTTAQCMGETPAPSETNSRMYRAISDSFLSAIWITRVATKSRRFIYLLVETRERTPTLQRFTEHPIKMAV